MAWPRASPRSVPGHPLKSGWRQPNPYSSVLCRKSVTGRPSKFACFSWGVATSAYVTLGPQEPHGEAQHPLSCGEQSYLPGLSSIVFSWDVWSILNSLANGDLAKPECSLLNNRIEGEFSKSLCPASFLENRSIFELLLSSHKQSGETRPLFQHFA